MPIAQEPTLSVSPDGHTVSAGGTWQVSALASKRVRFLGQEVPLGRVDKALKKAIAACEKAQDYVSRDMLIVQLEDTEMDHAYFLEKQLRLIEQIGLANYLQSQMHSSNAV